MGNAGTALMGIGTGKGKTRATDAALAAISSPLLDFPIAKAKGIVFNIVGGSDMTLQEINAAAEVIYENVDADANIIFGALVDDKLNSGEVSITVLATGFATDFFETEAAAPTAASGKRSNKGDSPSSSPPSAAANKRLASSSIAATPAQGIARGAPQLQRPVANTLPPRSARPPPAASPSRRRYEPEAVVEDEYESEEAEEEQQEEYYEEDEQQIDGDDADYDRPLPPASKRNVNMNRYPIIPVASTNGNNDGNRPGRRMAGGGSNAGALPEVKKKRGGLFGWIKRLFRGDDSSNNNNNNSNSNNSNNSGRR